MSRSPRRGARRISAAIFAALAVAGAAACGSEKVTTDPTLPPDNPRNPQFRNAAFVMNVNTRDRTVQITEPTVRINPSLVGRGGPVIQPLGPSFSILAGDVVQLTTANYTASAVGQFQPGKVRVEFDVFITNRLASVDLITPTFPVPPAGTAGVLLFPFETSVIVTSGGTSVGGDGTEVDINNPSYGVVAASPEWDGAPFNFFNDAGCPAGANDCYPFQLFGTPLGAGATSEARRVGFDIDPTVANFRARLIVAADLQNSGPAQTGTIAGSVTSPQRGALSGVTVTATPGGLSGSTSGTGAYSIGSVTTGPKTVALSTLPAGCTNPGSQGTTVTNGGTATVNFVVTCTPFQGTVNGTISSSLGGGISGASVVVTPTGGSAMAPQSSNGTGVYSVPAVQIIAGAGTGSIALGNLPAGCTNPGPQAYSGLTDGGTVTVDITVVCAPAPAGYAYSSTWGAPSGGTVTLTLSINMGTFNDPAVNGANPDDIFAIQGSFSYQTGRLTFQSCANVGGSGLQNVTSNGSTPGVVQWQNFTTNPALQTGVQGIAVCTFAVAAGAPQAVSTGTTISIAESAASNDLVPRILVTEGTLNLP